ncbi:MAG TPA: hypothetical protein DCF42_07720 [Lachnospiraceae bacterium]|nr:hypothetical protein [Lachnospiraceae bacterium]
MKKKKIMTVLMTAALVAATAATPALAAGSASASARSAGSVHTAAAPVKYVDGVYRTGIQISNTQMILVADVDHDTCEVTVKNGNEYTVKLRLNSSGYAYLYPGTAEQAAAADESAWAPKVEDSAGYATYTFKVSSLDTELSFAKCSKTYLEANHGNGHSLLVTEEGKFHGKQIWYDMTVKISSAGLTTEAEAAAKKAAAKKAAEKKAIRAFKAKKVSGLKVKSKKKAVKVTFKKVKSAKNYTVAYKVGKAKKWKYKTVKSGSLTLKAKSRNVVKVKVKANTKIGKKTYSTKYTKTKSAKTR